MRTLLHLLTHADNSLATEMINRQSAEGAAKIVVLDLTKPELDYKQLLERIFEADSVQVW
jgi:hypothetical protein